MKNADNPEARYEPAVLDLSHKHPDGAPRGDAAPGRVAILVERLATYGGTEVFARRLALALAEKGHQVDVLCARAETDPPPGVHVVTLGRPPLGKAVKAAWFAIAAERARKRGHYEVVISCGNTLAQDIARVSGGPLRIFQEKSIRAYPSGLARLAKRLRRALSPANAVVRAIQQRQFAAPGRVVCVSHLVRDWMAEAFPHLKAHGMDVVYNQPDLTRFRHPSEAEREAARASFGIAPGEAVVSLAGTNFMLKGVSTAVAAMAELPPHVRLLIAGGRNPARFAAQAARLGVGNRVTFLGRVTDMPRLYYASDVFVLPTFYDTCANVVLEALASGVRAITTRDNGASFFLPKHHVLDDPADHHGLAALVAQALDEHASSRFSWPTGLECGIEPYVTLVEETLAAKRASPRKESQ